MALTIRQFNYKEITPRNIGHYLCPLALIANYLMVPTKAGLLSRNFHFPLSDESSPVATHYLCSRKVA